jgi:hypothetical protein
VLHSFPGQTGSRPAAGVIFDAQGNLYGTAEGFEYEKWWGSVFEIIP